MNRLKIVSLFLFLFIANVGIMRSSQTGATHSQQAGSVHVNVNQGNGQEGRYHNYCKYWPHNVAVYFSLSAVTSFVMQLLWNSVADVTKDNNYARLPLLISGTVAGAIWGKNLIDHCSPQQHEQASFHPWWNLGAVAVGLLMGNYCGYGVYSTIVNRLSGEAASAEAITKLPA